MDDNKNLLFEFIRRASQSMQDDYNTIQTWAKEDPGSAGDQGEENWATLLRQWLPSTFHIVTKGRIIGYDGTMSPQIDIVILKPEYPKGLYDSRQKIFLACGVLAAFECKLTLNQSHIKKFFENSIKIKSLVEKKEGTPYDELHSGILYGLLAHSHSWKRNNTKVQEHISKSLFNELDKTVTSPLLMPDLVCVANLCYWNNVILPYIGPSYNVQWTEELKQKYGENGSCVAYYVHQNINDKYVYPIGGLLQSITTKLAWYCEGLCSLSDYYAKINIGGSGEGIGKSFDIAQIYSGNVKNDILHGRLVTGVHSKWHKWSMIFQ